MEFVKRFAELGIKDVPLVGGKNASLGEMYRELKQEGVEVPNGFATTADAYRLYIEHNNLHERIAKELDALDTTDVRALAISGARIRQWIMHGTMPQQLVDEIREAYKELEAEYGDNIDVAVRSSATAEDLPNASFAGQQETYLNIRGTNNLMATCKQVFASLFTDRAISYRVHQGFEHMDVALSIGVQQMVRADIGASGVMFSIDTETGFRDVVFITAAYGLGETVVQGSVNPDEFYVFKPTLAQGKRPILKRQLGEKAIKMIYTSDPMAGMSTRTVNVGRAEQRKFAITDEEVLQLARYAAIIEKHYERPMDIEWAKDGNTGRLYILQARPETVQAGLDATMHEVFRLKSRGEVLATGKSVGQRIATGKAR
ncbi:MAG TPA: PEP/pyruvate-binding domain-containing protein, partial [Gammaproteobacteria bacterium]